MTHHSRLGAALIMMTLVLSISTSALAVGSGGTGARSLTVDTDVFLGGDYIKIGISSTGSFGTKSAAPTSGGVFFHPNSTDVRNAPSANSLGLRANSSGWEAPDETKDFFLPGAIDEGFLIGWSSAPGSSATTRGVGSQISHQHFRPVDRGHEHRHAAQSRVHRHRGQRGNLSSNNILRAVRQAVQNGRHPDQHNCKSDLQPDLCPAFRPGPKRFGRQLPDR